jgi:hypothetical protein
MARVAVSQLPREAAEIKPDDWFLVDQPSVADPVTSLPGDTRRVSPSVLADGMARQAAVIGLVGDEVAAEEARARAAEGNLQNLATAGKTSLAAAINTVKLESDANAQQVTIMQGRIDSAETAIASRYTKAETDALVLEVKTSTYHFTGWVSGTDPGARAKPGELWHEGAGMPDPATAWPLTVKQWDGAAWQDFGYTPADFDIWSAADTGDGWYWFAEGWNRLDQNLDLSIYRAAAAQDLIDGGQNTRLGALESGLPGKADKVSGAVAGNLAVLDAGGNPQDSGKNADEVGIVETVDGVGPVSGKDVELHRQVSIAELRDLYGDPSLAEPGVIYVLPEEAGWDSPCPVRIAAAKKYNGATTALKFKFKRALGFNPAADANIFYRVKARVKNIHSGAFFDFDASWIPQTAAYDFCALVKYNTPAETLPAAFVMSTDSDGYFAWIALAASAGNHWEASAEMWAAGTGDSVVSGAYEPEISFEPSNPAAERTKATVTTGA